MNKKIAILGATSHIAKGLIINFTQHPQVELFLFARDPAPVKNFLKKHSAGANFRVYNFNHFGSKKYDVIINCIGLGTIVKVVTVSGDVFRLAEKFDNMIVEQLYRYPKTLYINFSSGAVYSVTVNDIGSENYYGITKLYQEAKHRYLRKLNIVDIRVFAYFSRYIDLNGGFFITELLKCLKNKKVFVASPEDFIRDFIGPDDLFNLTCLLIKSKPFNGVVDAYSSAPVSKFKLLKYFAGKYSLKYVFDRKLKLNCPTGTKSLYCSKSKKAASLGYKPNFSSLNTIATESTYLLGEANE